MSRVNFVGAARKKWKKKRRGGTWELKKPGESRPSNLDSLRIDVALPHQKVINVVLSGWAYGDGFPLCAQEFVETESRGKPIVAVFFHVGINSIRGDLTVLRSPEQRATARNDMRSAFVSLVSEMFSLYAGAELVWLGTSTIRRKRVEGDSHIFSPLTTTVVKFSTKFLAL